MARRKQNNEPEKKGVDPGRFFAVAGKSEGNTNVEGKKGSAASRTVSYTHLRAHET